jgi:hypothetical protein
MPDQDTKISTPTIAYQVPSDLPPATRCGGCIEDRILGGEGLCFDHRVLRAQEPTLTLTHACGHSRQVPNDVGAADRIEFLRQYNCFACFDKTGVMRPQAVCRVCGCTEADCRGCIAKTGAPCYWVDSTVLILGSAASILFSISGFFFSISGILRTGRSHAGMR